ncbi:Protein C07F11.2, partial [Aphelenchoides avenae]
MKVFSPTSPPAKASSPTTPTAAGSPNRAERIRFRYVWPVKVSLRQLSPTEAIILHISPKFATVHDHVSFQWTLKMQGTANL